MSSAVQKISSALKQALQWLKLPWQMTGPVSSPEFLESVPNALQYRINAPATPSKRAIIPHAEPDRVLNIAYYPRDQSRAPYTVVRKRLDVSKLPEHQGLPSPRVIKFGYRVHLDDCPGDGYQK